MKNITKAELHVHLEGAIHPRLAMDLAQKNGEVLAKERVQDDVYVWTDFLDFLSAFDSVGMCLSSGLDYRAITYAYLKECAESGAAYVELMVSPEHAAMRNISFEAFMEGLVSACVDAEQDFGIVGRLIVTCVRHLGGERATAVAQQLKQNMHPFVVGFGMGGDENFGAFRDFQPAYDIAGHLGLGLTVHAGEVRGPESIREALDTLPVTRLGHGVRVIEDMALLDECMKRGIHFEVCPGSNIALKVAPSYEDHPLHTLHAAGARYSLNSDDPPFFHTTLEDEYTNGQLHFGLSDDDLRAVTVTALEDSFSAEGRALAQEV